MAELVNQAIQLGLARALCKIDPSSTLAGLLTRDSRPWRKKYGLKKARKAQYSKR